MTWLHDAIAWLGGALIALAAAMGLGGDGGLLLSVQGYVEGEYVYVGAPVAGRLETLHVARGDQVAAGAPLFQLDRASEQPARDEAAARLARAEAQLADLKKGKRPSEVESVEAQLAQAKAMLELSELALKRREQLVETRAASREAVDEAHAAYERDKARVAELEAELRTAQLGARADEIQAAEAEVTAARAALAQAEWRLDELSQAARRRASWSIRCIGAANGWRRAHRSYRCCRPRTSSCASSCPSRGSARLRSATKCTCAAIPVRPT